jgi:hypothetical protein
MLDTDEAFRHLQDNVKAPPNAADRVLNKLHQRRRRSMLASGAAGAALVAGSLIAVTQSAGHPANDSTPIASDAPTASPSLTETEIEEWQRSVDAYTDNLVNAANGHETYAGSAYDNERRTITIFGVGEPPPEVSKLISDHPDHITAMWVQVPYTASELQAAAQAVFQHPAVGESSVGRDYSHIEVSLKPNSGSSEDVAKELREFTDIPIRVSDDPPVIGF